MFAGWLGLDEEKRSEIETLMGIAIDLRTLDIEADDGHFDEGAATDTSDLEPPVQHSDGNPIPRHAVMAAVARLRSL
jgi:hypothetical protein